MVHGDGMKFIGLLRGSRNGLKELYCIMGNYDSVFLEFGIVTKNLDIFVIAKHSVF